jgi:hypothetical protein
LHGNSRVWLPALKAAGLSAIHFHDLRHAGNTLAASAGASLRELMERMGQDSERAALEASLLKIIRGSQETGPDLQGKLGAPSATRTRDLLLVCTAAPALCRPATTHVTSERNRHRQLLSERSWSGQECEYLEAPRASAAALSAPAPMLGLPSIRLE